MNIAPARGSRILLAAIPFFLIVMVYIIGSAERRAANPDDKLLPPISEITATMVPNDAPAIGSSPTVSPKPSPIRVEIPSPSNSRCRLAAVSVHNT